MITRALYWQVIICLGKIRFRRNHWFRNKQLSFFELNEISKSFTPGRI